MVSLIPWSRVISNAKTTGKEMSKAAFLKISFWPAVSISSTQTTVRGVTC